MFIIHLGTVWAKPVSRSSSLISLSALRLNEIIFCTPAMTYPTLTRGEKTPKSMYRSPRKINWNFLSLQLTCENTCIFRTTRKIHEPFAEAVVVLYPLCHDTVTEEVKHAVFRNNWSWLVILALLETPFTLKKILKFE